MNMVMPLFFLFSVYGVVNAYLPILLTNQGYSAFYIGLLLSFFEGAGLIFPLFFTARVDKKGNYGTVMIVLALLIFLAQPALVYAPYFWVTAFFLIPFGIGFKGLVPVSDGLTTHLLGERSSDYGKVRVAGTLGFVFVSLLLQFTPLLNPARSSSIAFWIAVPTLLFIISVFIIPGLMTAYPAVDEGMAHKSVENSLHRLSDFPASFWVGIGLIFLGFLGLVPSQRFFSLYVQDFLHSTMYAALWALSAMVEIPFMYFSGTFLKWFGPKRLIFSALAAIAIRNLSYACIPGLAGAVIGQLLHGICFGLFHPAAIHFISGRIPRKHLVLALTIYISLGTGLSSVTGNLLGGFLIDFFGYPVLFTVFAGFPLLGLVLFTVTYKKGILR